MKIENFSIGIDSLEKATIYYTKGDQEFEQLIEIEVEYSGGEVPSFDCPGFPPEAQITSAFGLSVEEREAWEDYLDSAWGYVETQLFEFIEQDMIDRQADRAEYLRDCTRDDLVTGDM